MIDRRSGRSVRLRRPSPSNALLTWALLGGVSLLPACGEDAAKALVEADYGFGAPPADRDQGGYTIDPEAIGGTPGSGGTQPGTGGTAADTDAAVPWMGDAAAPPTEPPAMGACTEGERQACQAEGCVGGLQVCRDGMWSDCSPPPETCNDRDDDCDGEIDENFPSVGTACQAGGDCQGEGVFVCKADGSGVECQLPPGSGGVPEICDGLDNDCDGVIDEDFPNERCCQRSADCAPGQTCDDTGHCTGGDPLDPGGGGGGGGGLDFNAPLAPPGAACGSAQDIPGPGDYPGATGGNGDEGSCGFFPTGGGESAFTLTRDADTEVTLYAMGDLFVNTVLYVRTDCLDPGTELACNDDTENDFLNSDAELTCTARAGQTYASIVDPGGTGGTFTLLVDESVPGGGGGGPVDPPPPPPPPPPPVDAVGTCAEPLEMPAGGVLAGDTDTGADATSVACVDSGSAPETIVHYRPAVAGTATFTTEGSGFDTVLSLRSDCAAAANELACNDDNGAGGQWSRVAAEVVAGADYYVVVEGYSGESGPFTLNLAFEAAPVLACGPGAPDCPAGEACFATSCDPIPAGLCADAVALQPGVPAMGTLDAATPDAVPTGDGCNGPHGAERVFAFVPDHDGPARIETTGSRADTVLSIYDDCGAQVGAGRPCVDDAGGSIYASIQFDATAGHMYFAVVEGYHGDTGDIQVTYRARP